MASERGKAQTSAARLEGCRVRLTLMLTDCDFASGTSLERPTKEGDSPVRESKIHSGVYLSTTIHVKCRGNLR